MYLTYTTISRYSSSSLSLSLSPQAKNASLKSTICPHPIYVSTLISLLDSLQAYYPLTWGVVVESCGNCMVSICFYFVSLGLNTEALVTLVRESRRIRDLKLRKCVVKCGLTVDLCTDHKLHQRVCRAALLCLDSVVTALALAITDSIHIACTVRFCHRVIEISCTHHLYIYIWYFKVNLWINLFIRLSSLKTLTFWSSLTPSERLNLSFTYLPPILSLKVSIHIRFFATVHSPLRISHAPGLVWAIPTLPSLLVFGNTLYKLPWGPMVWSTCSGSTWAQSQFITVTVFSSSVFDAFDFRSGSTACESCGWQPSRVTFKLLLEDWIISQAMASCGRSSNNYAQQGLGHDPYGMGRCQRQRTAACSWLKPSEASQLMILESGNSSSKCLGPSEIRLPCASTSVNQINLWHLYLGSEFIWPDTMSDFLLAQGWWIRMCWDAIER